MTRPPGAVVSDSKAVTAAVEDALAHGQRLVKPAAAYEFCGGFSASTAHRLIAAGQFPKPITLFRDSRGRPVRTAFLLSELVAWCAAKVKADRG